MNKFIAFSFLVLGVGFYELSGGSDFVPETRGDAPVLVTRAQPLETVSPAIAEPVIADPAKVAAVTENDSVQLVSYRSDEPVTELPKIDLSKFDAPEPQPEVVEQATAGFIGTDIRQVTGNRVNVRGGPGTDFDVVAQAVLGDEVEVIIDDGTGWVQLRFEGGQTGWMADFLLSD